MLSITSIDIPILKIERSSGCIVLIIGIAMPGKTILILEQGPVNQYD